MNLIQLEVQYQIKLRDIYSADEVKSIFYLVVEHLLQYKRTDYLMHKTDELATDIILEFKDILNDLTSGKPIQYILNNAEFYGIQFRVDGAVLIPRPETEELVDWIINDYAHHSRVKVLDVGTGSGCIAIALKKNLANATLTAIDFSAKAITVAKENASINALDVDFLLVDILQPSHDLLQQRFDVIVSNPPYIKEDEKPAMHNNVLANEPHSALFVSNEKPLIFYEAIADFALTTLQKGGKLYFEINEYLGAETVQMLADKSFINITLKKDMQGKDRMISASLA